MRLCGALALVLVASLVLAFEVMRRPRHRAPARAMAEIAEPAPPQVRAPRPSLPAYRPPPARIALPPPPPAKIAGHVRLPDDVDEDIEVVARPNGAEQWETTGAAHENAFRIEGLLAGRRYDIEFRGSDVRTLRLTGVVAPADDLDVTLEPRAVLHVAVGFPRGERCPIDSVAVREHGAGDTGEQGLLIGNSPDCRFDIDAPAHAGLATIVAEGGGLVLEATVNVPAHGDPEPICLNPPCRENPLEGQAHLRVMLNGVPSSSSIEADIIPVSDADTSYACASSLFTCDIEALPIGQTFAVTASGRDCRGGPVTVTIVEGENDVRIPCVRAQPTDEPTGEPADDADT